MVLFDHEIPSFFVALFSFIISFGISCPLAFIRFIILSNKLEKERGLTITFSGTSKTKSELHFSVTIHFLAALTSPGYFAFFGIESTIILVLWNILLGFIPGYLILWQSYKKDAIYKETKNPVFANIGGDR